MYATQNYAKQGLAKMLTALWPDIGQQPKRVVWCGGPATPSLPTQ